MSPDEPPLPLLGAAVVVVVWPAAVSTVFLLLEQAASEAAVSRPASASPPILFRCTVVSLGISIGASE